ncbi:hypothetical protein [Saccharolobus shibatae]|uniref:Uncharacterized protein n=1 Tax=Saccharolobus shibatae TaxID=2286 RepID=A0A8F5C0L7_9CREN|nr:hypothetical protein [Saccharolobus shibatae]QXJ34872.1 hypothetical protein J5U22_01419 [Saccharolobus shibatae]
MKNVGFHEEKLEFYKGENYSLSKRIRPWEVHVIIYPDGFIDSYFEVSREYFEHLTYKAIPSIYEPFESYKTAYNKLHVFDAVVKSG